MAKRRYCKNTVPGKQGRGKKYPAAVRAEVVMAMIGSNSICAVARRYGVPESTIRSWMAEEAGKPDGVFAAARAEAAREIAARAAVGAKAQVSYLQQRVAENQRAAEVREKLHRRLDEDARARKYTVGALLKSQEEELADATETGMVVYSQPGSYDRELDEAQRKELEAQLERYDSRVMTDRDAANVAAVLLTVAGAAAALVPQDTTDRDSGQSTPAVLMEPRGTEDEAEVILDGPG
ncbi:helix-turn-helix domain-containing protein [uncultured Faecalibacterium sp.]|uniref:helix-turn-helix domain-containing protein n=1 Tax=uncultured Faecalibacterium sp. TaxID=259315 RepID=UPI0026DAE28B|nr:helix-turn-helix domain-containing protein [uncultured Faecalibacterium sp.]